MRNNTIALQRTVAEVLAAEVALVAVVAARRVAAAEVQLCFVFILGEECAPIHNVCTQYT